MSVVDWVECYQEEGDKSYHWSCSKKLKAITGVSCKCGKYRCCLEHDLNENPGAVILIVWMSLTACFVTVIAVWACIALTLRKKNKVAEKDDNGGGTEYFNESFDEDLNYQTVNSQGQLAPVANKEEVNERLKELEIDDDKNELNDQDDVLSVLPDDPANDSPEPPKNHDQDGPLKKE